MVFAQDPATEGVGAVGEGSLADGEPIEVPVVPPVDFPGLIGPGQEWRPPGLPVASIPVVSDELVFEDGEEDGAEQPVADEPSADDSVESSTTTTTTSVSPAEPSSTEPTSTEPTSTEPTSTEPVATEPPSTEAGCFKSPGDQDQGEMVAAISAAKATQEANRSWRPALKVAVIVLAVVACSGASAGTATVACAGAASAATSYLDHAIDGDYSVNAEDLVAGALGAATAGALNAATSSIARRGVPSVVDDSLNATKAVRYGPTNPGPLHALRNADDVVGSFRSGSYSQLTLADDTMLYRVYGGDAGQLSPYWTRTKPSGPLQSQLDSALNPAWGNTATDVAAIRVPAGTTIFEGAAAGQPLAGGGSLLGGGNQVYIPTVDPAWLVAP